MTHRKQDCAASDMWPTIQNEDDWDDVLGIGQLAEIKGEYGDSSVHFGTPNIHSNTTAMYAMLPRPILENGELTDIFVEVSHVSFCPFCGQRLEEPKGSLATVDMTVLKDPETGELRTTD